MTIQVSKLWDKDYEVVLKIVGSYSANAAASNTVVLQANTLNGANSSQTCYLDFTHAEFAMGLANGFISLEFQSKAPASQANSTILTVGKRATGELSFIAANPLAANATGDINLNTTALDANDSFTLVLSFRKNVTTNPSAWANVENKPPFQWQ